MQPVSARAEYLASIPPGHYHLVTPAAEIAKYSSPAPTSNCSTLGNARKYLKTRERSASYIKARKAAVARETEVAATMLALRAAEVSPVENKRSQRGSMMASDGYAPTDKRASFAVGRTSGTGRSSSVKPALLSVTDRIDRSLLISTDEEVTEMLPVVSEPDGNVPTTSNSFSLEFSRSSSLGVGMSERRGRRASLSLLMSQTLEGPEGAGLAAARNPRRASLAPGGMMTRAAPWEASLDTIPRRFSQLRTVRAAASMASGEHRVPATVIEPETLPPPIDSPYRRFRRIARMVAHSVHFVKFLARILKNPIEWSWEYDPKTYSEEDVSVSVPTPEAAISGASSNAATNRHKTSHTPGMPLLMSHEIFGVSHLFSKPKKFQGWLDNEMRMRFRKKPGTRTQQDLDAMTTWCSTMKCMEKYSPSVQRALMSAAVYTRWHSSRQIFKEGHPVGRFYIILDGEIEITRIDRAKVMGARNKTAAHANLITSRRMTVASDIRPSSSHVSGGMAGIEVATPPPLDAMQAALDARQAKVDGFALRRSLRAGMINEDGSAVDNLPPALTEEEIQEDARAVKQIEDDLNKAYTITMGYMGAGESFDIAFLTSATRATTSTTNRLTELLTISKRDYENIMSTFKEAETVKQDMLRTHPVFRSLNGDIATLINCVSMKRFDTNKAVVCQGTHSGSIFFIVSGTCRVIQSVNFVKRDLCRGMFRISRMSDVVIESPKLLPKAPSQAHASGMSATTGGEMRASTGSLASTFRASGNILSSGVDFPAHQQQQQQQQQQLPTSQQQQARPTSGSAMPPAAPSLALPSRCRLVTELLVVRSLGPGDYFGQSLSGNAAAALRPANSSSAGSAPGSAASTSGTQHHMSVVTNEKCTLLAISKLDFHRLASDTTWRFLREEAARYPAPGAIEDAYLDKRTWNVAKRRILTEIMKSKQMRKPKKDERDPYGIEGDGRLAWAV
ncbi:hypothetical protein HDU87_007553 [Geranomyces variabilis]|uniref:Cyclic nucleotide-binding domain-containing protein n=1 Tax=Geranomyces variabilis TaxID=109894 RepID=A0AAD5TRQ5_9FUNG|nr:hypothetical protein HDU87_007553 [Geranomyces variabilis]